MEGWEVPLSVSMAFLGAVGILVANCMCSDPEPVLPSHTSFNWGRVNPPRS